MTTRTPLRVRILRTTLLSIVAGTVTVLGVHRYAHTAEPAVAIPPPAVDEPASDARSETAVFAGGCFWGVQGVFQHVKGVRKALSGYAGGSRGDAHYEKVGEGDTGHAESVQVTFDPREVSYGQLLQVYFSVAHDPTQLNRQGPDSGTQYRSTIFAATPQQQDVAARYIAQLDKAGAFARPIVTTIETGKAFFPAEDYHQNYLSLHPREPYIAINDLPKVEHLKTMFPALYRDPPVLVNAALH
jgi:peptide-methionine (S)-S-oxide reductase